MPLAVWEIRRAQAEKFRSWSNVLAASSEIEGAFYLAHMATELILKSAIAKQCNGWHPAGPDSHKLNRIVSDPKTQFLFVAMANDQNSNVHKLFLEVTSQNRAWEMQYRYEGTKLSRDDMARSLELYKEIFLWTAQNYVQ